MVEWRNVKIPDISGTQDEILACWGWRDESPLAHYNVKTWFWPPPGQLTVPSSIETSMTFPAIEVLVSQPQDQWLKETAERYFGSVDNAPPMPDKQLLCFENLFYGEFSLGAGVSRHFCAYSAPTSTSTLPTPRALPRRPGHAR